MGADEPGPGLSDERLAALIGSGLAGRAGGPVDLESLLDGARTGARRIRRRRRMGAVALAAVVIAGVPIGLRETGVIHGRGDAMAADGGSAGSSRSGPTSDAGPVDPSVAASASPSGGVAELTPSLEMTVPGGQQVSGAAPIGIEDAAVLQADDVTAAPVRATADRVVSVDRGPTVQRVCRSTLPAVDTLAGGRQLDYVEAGHSRDPWTVTTLVRVLAKDASTTEMNGLRRSMGNCTSDLQLRRAAVSGVPGDAVVLGWQVGAAADRPRAVLVVGVVRQGRATASVELVVPARAAAGEDARVRLGLEQARHLLALADQRLVSSGLVARAAADPNLS